jgi:hypothetical protein
VLCLKGRGKKVRGSLSLMLVSLSRVVVVGRWLVWLGRVRNE